ncbi:MAG: DUF6282 family protein [Thermodesulfobacteriota bacterium]
MNTNALKGVMDMHLHSHPDIAPRKADDIELAKMASDAGMGGFLLKAHIGSSVERAYLVQKMFPDIHVFGGIVLNYPIGGLNPHAVEAFVRLGAKEVWMPSLSAQNMFSYMHAHSTQEDQIAFHKAHGGSSDESSNTALLSSPKPWSKNGHGISILDEKEKILPEVNEILEIISAADTILGTGHLSIKETNALLKAALEKGAKRLLVTHPEYMAEMSMEDQLYWRRKGVFFDRCYFFTNQGSKSIGGAKPFNILVNNIRTVGVDSTVLGTDAGQLKNDFPVEIMKAYLTKLSEAGFTDNEIEQMAVKTPAALLNLQ